MTAGNSGITTVPEVYLKSCGLDCIVPGQGEVASVELVDAAEKSTDWQQVPGIAWLDNDGEQRELPLREPIFRCGFSALVRN